MNILKEVFRNDNGAYARENTYWTSHSLLAMADRLPAEERAPVLARVRTLENVYRELSDTYQASKGETDIPLA